MRCFLSVIEQILSPLARGESPLETGGRLASPFYDNELSVVAQLIGPIMPDESGNYNN